MQSIVELNQWYSNKDPWGYKTNPDDAIRRDHLVRVASTFGPFERLLDIGAGEGWLTQFYPATHKFGYEVSDAAANRFPDSVVRVLNPTGKYDLITCTGIFYAQYDWQTLLKMAKTCAQHCVLVSSIKDWEVPAVNLIGQEVHREEFKYREYTQLLRMFKV